MMRERRILLFGSTALALTVMQPGAATADITEKAQAHARVASALHVVSATQMTFGTFAPGGQAGSAELSPVSGLIRCNMASIGGDGSKPAALTVSAEPGQTFGLALTDIARVGRDSMEIEISSFTHDAGATPVVDFSGTRELKVGATLYVSGLAPNGRYRGNFEVIVTNN